MPKRKHYSPEYKHELVELVRRSKSSCRNIALQECGPLIGRSEIAVAAGK